MIENEELRVEDHSDEIRRLRWQKKQLDKQLGKTGQKIHELRCQLAESREINGKIARGQVHDLERQVARDAEIIAVLRTDNTRLTEQFLELHAKSVAASVD